MPNKQSFTLSHFAPSAQLLETLAFANGGNLALNLPTTAHTAVLSNAQQQQNQLQRARVAAQLNSSGRRNLIALAQQRQLEAKQKAANTKSTKAPTKPTAAPTPNTQKSPATDPSPPPLTQPNPFSPSFQDKENFQDLATEFEDQLNNEVGAACLDEDEIMAKTRRAETISKRRAREAAEAAKKTNSKTRSPKHKSPKNKPKSPANGVVHPPAGAPVIPKVVTKKVGKKEMITVDPQAWATFLESLQAHTKESDALASRNEQLEEILASGAQDSEQGAEDNDDEAYNPEEDGTETAKMTPELKAHLLQIMQLQAYQQQQGPKKLKLEDGTGKVLPAGIAANRAEERMEDMTELIEEACEKFVFRRFKFIENEKQLKDACMEALKWIVQRNDIEVDQSEEKFFEIYNGAVSSELSTRRNYVVSELKKKHKDFSRFWKGRVPTTEELFEVWTYADLDPETQDPEEQFKVAVLKWYHDHFLTIAAGHYYWGENIKNYRTPVDTVDVLGVRKVLITIASEAFALAVWENNYEKWNKLLKAKEKNHSFKVPQKVEDGAAEYDAKWSNQRKGKSTYCNWDKEGVQFYRHCKGIVRDNREADGAKERMNKALDLVRAEKKITAWEPNTSGKKKSKTVVIEPEAVIEIEEE